MSGVSRTRPVHDAAVCLPSPNCHRRWVTEVAPKVSPPVCVAASVATRASGIGSGQDVRRRKRIDRSFHTFACITRTRPISTTHSVGPSRRQACSANAPDWPG